MNEEVQSVVEDKLSRDEDVIDSPVECHAGACQGRAAFVQQTILLSLLEQGLISQLFAHPSCMTISGIDIKVQENCQVWLSIGDHQWQQYDESQLAELYSLSGGKHLKDKALLNRWLRLWTGESRTWFDAVALIPPALLLSLVERGGDVSLALRY